MSVRARLAAGMLALLAACSRESPRPAEAVEASVSAPPVLSSASAPAEEPSSSPPSPIVPPSPMATVQLLDPGKAPRRVLRYAWRTDQKEQLVLDLLTSATTEVGGVKQPEIPLPPVRIAIAIEPLSVSPEGDLRYAWRVTTASVNLDAGTSPEIGEGMRVQVEPIAHMSGTGVETAQGLSKEVTIDPASVDAGAQAQQMMVQVVETLRDVAAPLPAEPVGVGARWQELARLDARGAHVAQTDTFTLTSLKGDTGELDDARAQTASPQTLAGVPGAGPAPRVDSMLISGQAKTRFALTRLVPRMTFEGMTQMMMSGQGAQPAHATINMHVKIALEGTTGAPR